MNVLTQWYRMQPDERGFRQAVRVVVQRLGAWDKADRPWVACVEHVNLFGHYFAVSLPCRTHRDAKALGVELAELMGLEAA